MSNDTDIPTQPVTVLTPRPVEIPPNSPFAMAKDAKALKEATSGNANNDDGDFAAPATKSKSQDDPHTNGAATAAKLPQSRTAEKIKPPESTKVKVASHDPATTPQSSIPIHTALVSIKDTTEPSQILLRALFGAPEDMTRAQVIEKINKLEGVQSVRTIGADEVQALKILRVSMQSLGFVDKDSLRLMAGTQKIDFLEETGTTLAVLRDGNYGPGVRETLVLVARELSKLK